MSELSDNKEYCPFCHVNLRDKPIPEKYRHHYGGATYGSRKIAVYSRDEDRTVKWQCPDCGKEWERE
ncbi:hypothetical protein ABET36_07535 [Caldifermentibacillus hisashii]|jgi:hypothetical protein|uniref:hypothetical protein n=1 Tax=Caldifermentibacillus hisashii TaxID=996558 RepID=UPI003D23DF60